MLIRVGGQMEIPVITETNMSVTLADVAAEAGLGESTVSRVLRNEGSFSKKSHEKVMSAAEKLGYVPNRIAGSLASSGTKLVAVIIPSLTNIVFADVLRGAGEALEAAGYRGVFGVSDYDTQKEERLIASFLEYRPAAVLLAGLDHSEQSLRMLKASDCRIVEMLDIDDRSKARQLDIIVGFSNFDAGSAAAEHLLACGYRRIGYVGHDLSRDPRAAKRLKGFCAQLQVNNVALAAQDISWAESSVGLGKQGLINLLKSAPDIDAVYFSNDDMAIGGLFHCMSANISVPEELGIVGHNGLDIGQELPRRLSTIKTPRAEIGRLAAQLALQDGEKTIIDLGFVVVEGATTQRKHGL